METKTNHSATYSRFACIGAGFSGIGIGATLKRWYGITDIQIFEREADLGGTWFINKYPGCACDVPSVLYSYSFAPNAEWTRVLAPFNELQAYLQKVAADYDLTSRIAFNSTVERCEWSEARQRWRITVRDNSRGTVYYHECQFLYSGIGQLIEPKLPDIPGLDGFKGDIFHASRWPQDLSLKGKKVVVIGNGCTAAQIVPAIVDDTASLTQFIRSKHWYLEPLQASGLPVWRFLFRNVPGVLKMARFAIFAFGEYHFRGFHMTKSGTAHRKAHEADAKKYMKETAPEKYLDLLIPDYAIGCKRRIYDPGYLSALHNDKITLTDNPIVEVVPEGVRTANGVTEADVIVMATGYTTNTFLPRIDVIGRGGKTAKEHWDENDGIGAYNTTMMSGFPNFFFLLGPNTVTGHTSTILAIENAANYSMRIIKPVLDGKSVSVDCLPEAEVRYIQDIQDATHNTVFFAGGCNSWYFEEKDGKKPHNPTTYPYSQIHYWYRSMFPVYDDLAYTPPRNPRPLNPVRQFLKVAFFTIMILMSAKGLRAFRAAVKEHGLKDLVMGYGAMALIRVQMLRMKLQAQAKKA